MRQVSAAIEIGTSKVVCTIAESGAYEGFNLLGASTIDIPVTHAAAGLSPRK